jgi:murein DD-endopeptidase MepM/ murein hydrolase activator NlpD
MATEETISFRTSKWKRFDPDFAEMIRTKHPDIWKLGGNIRGNDQYRKLYPITKRNGVPNSQIEIDALKLREAWNARHYNDFRIAGVIAQVKWLAVGSRGEQYMKNLINEEIEKRSDSVSQSISLENHLAHYGKKGMRWGVRKSSSGKASAKVAKRTTYKKPPTKLSDAELQRRVRRLETEKRYIELNKATKTSNAGKKAASKVLSQTGNAAAGAIATAVVGLGVKAAMNKIKG